jgi:hypothetical protein
MLKMIKTARTAIEIANDIESMRIPPFYIVIRTRWSAHQAENLKSGDFLFDEPTNHQKLWKNYLSGMPYIMPNN